MENNRISELEADEVDHLRFDRIKIQRKRMEHILEVIKDLTFKNNQLMRENVQLRASAESDRQCRLLYEEALAEKRILAEKNATLGQDLQQYRETALQQEMLINSLKQEICQKHLEPRPSGSQRVPTQTEEGVMLMQEFAVLQAQYEALQGEYSALYQRTYQQDKENLERTAAALNRTHTRERLDKSLSPNYRSQLVLQGQTADKYARLRGKYERLKGVRRDLQREMTVLRGVMGQMRVRERKYEEIVELLKERKAVICMCHVNKLERMVEKEAAGAQ